MFAYQIDNAQAQISKLDGVGGAIVFNQGLSIAQGAPRLLATRLNSIYLERHNTSGPVTPWTVQAFEANAGTQQWTQSIPREDRCCGDAQSWRGVVREGG